MSKPTFTLFAVALAVASLLSPSRTNACLHGARSGGEPVPISQKGHQGLLVWDGHAQELRLRRDRF